ncbi:oncostatin-M-specific receptor subunit beta isoform X2 [Siniperca chuatsi]|uniref:oncostatin-M-specific receptor subunit beta isoform X2 n=1 Tax=Siniperca chuatsi TaxID=119488 RepID=UPI001CE1E68B|nr:oncostatin-M-specific receptor subunit beta isoform X2 [Siniperca chuatsi]
MMMCFRISLINLLGLYLIFSEDHSGCCLDTVWEPPRPSIGHLQAIIDKQSLLVSWLVNHSGLVGDIYEIQISRTENRTVIYNRNISVFSVDSDEYTWTWASDLPLECVDHSVRIRHFYNQSVPSPWSNWITNYGAQAKVTTEIFPNERMLREGTSAMFCCVPPRGVNITSMTLNNNKYNLISIGARVKAIAVDNLTIPTTIIKALSVSCSDATGKISYAWNYVSFPPQKPRNLSCATSDMTTVICTWDSGRKRYPHDRNKQTHTLHIENSDQAPIKCEELSCTFLAVPQLEEYNINVVLKDQLVFPVVEWDRVSPGVTDTTVSWIVQGNLTQLNLLCQVTTDPDSITELSGNSVSGLYKVKVEHLLPNTRYSARVRCLANGRLWGEWTQPVFFTTYPLVTLDVWRRIKQLSDPNGRQLTLLWIPHVPGSAATVNIQGYIVQWLQEGQNWTEWKDSEQTQAEVSIGPGQYDFTVQAVLHIGSTPPAHITIPQRDDGENLLVAKRLSSSTAAGFNLSWEEQDTATCGYTVEWCILGNALPCNLQWMKVPDGNNTLFLPARNFKAGCRFTFNIYACTENEHRLLEIQTGYSQELKSVKSPSLVEPVQKTSSSVTLEWRYDEDDPAHPAFITGYLVTVQEVGSDTLPGHAANLFSVSVADPHRKSVTIENLQQNQEYAFSVSALTKEGPGQPASVTTRTRTNNSAHLAKILTPIFLLLGCTILLWPQRKMLKSWLKDIFAYPAGMNIKIPELDSFLPETGERIQSQKVECSSCDIEILNTRPLNETTALRDPEPLNTLQSPGSQSASSTLSFSCVPLHANYCPQSATVWDRPILQQIACKTNKTYFYTMEEDSSEAQVMFDEINEPSESLQESCSVIYSYISNETL